MNAKDYLSRAYRIDLRINSKLEQVLSLRVLAEKATTTLSPIHYNGTRNIHRMEDVIVKIIELESEINAEVEKLVAIKREIGEAIKRVGHREHGILLELRYICCKTWEEIAAEMMYSVRSVHRIHGDALQEFKKVMPN